MRAGTSCIKILILGAEPIGPAGRNQLKLIKVHSLVLQERMKRVKHKKTVRWCARVRMYGDTYEEKILPPHGPIKPPDVGCGIHLFVHECLGLGSF